MKSGTLLLAVMLILSIGGFSRNVMASQDDAGSGSDAPDDYQNAISVALGVWYDGSVGDNLTNVDGDEDNHDNFKVTLSPGFVRVTVGITNIEVVSLATIEILKDGLIVAIETIWYDDGNVTVVAPIITTGDYVIQVESYSDLVDYRFRVDHFSGSYGQDDAGAGRDAELLTPVAVELNTTYTGNLGNGHVESDGLLDDEDYFRVTLPGIGYLNLSVTFTIDGSDFFHATSLTSEYKTIVTESQYSSFGSILMSTPIATGGDYFIEFDSLGWNITYEFSLSYVSAVLPPQNDAGTGGDASEDPASSPMVPLNSSFTGTIGEGLIEDFDGARDEEDTYLLNVTHYGRLEVNLTLVDSMDAFPAVFLDLYNSSELVSPSYLDMYVSNFRPSRSGEVVVTEGMYELELWTLDDNTTYSVSILFVELEEPSPPVTSEPVISSSTSSPTSSQVTSQPSASSKSTASQSSASSKSTTSQSSVSNTTTDSTPSASLTGTQDASLIVFVPMILVLIVRVRFLKKS